MEHLTKKDISLVKNSVRSAIRKSFSRSEQYKSFLNANRIEWYAGRRKRVSFKCAICEDKYGRGDIQVDHINPIGKGVYSSLEDAMRFFKLVYCTHDNLQILCKPCHKVKTRGEQANPSFDNMEF